MILLAGLRNSPHSQPGAPPASDAPVCPASPAADAETPVRHLSIRAREPREHFVISMCLFVGEQRQFREADGGWPV